jgi:hypothetical protein
MQTKSWIHLSDKEKIDWLRSAVLALDQVKASEAEVRTISKRLSDIEDDVANSR